MLQLGIIDVVQWCDTRDMGADGHTKGCIDRKGLIDLMKGFQTYLYEVKKHTPHRAASSSSSATDANSSAVGALLTVTSRVMSRFQLLLHDVASLALCNSSLCTLMYRSQI